MPDTTPLFHQDPRLYPTIRHHHPHHILGLRLHHSVLLHLTLLQQEVWYHVIFTFLCKTNFSAIKKIFDSHNLHFYLGFSNLQVAISKKVL